jgi:hypothetical protein
MMAERLSRLSQQPRIDGIVFRQFNLLLADDWF